MKVEKFELALSNEGILERETHLALQKVKYGPIIEILQVFKYSWRTKNLICSIHFSSVFMSPFWQDLAAKMKILHGERRFNLTKDFTAGGEKGSDA